MGKGRVPAWVWTVLMGAHALAMGWALQKGSWAFADSDRYTQVAINLARYGELYARPWPISSPRGQAVQEFTIRPPGYPLLVLATGAAVRQPWLLLLGQNLLSLLNIGLVLKWWARRPVVHRWGLALLITLLFPAQLIYANALMSELALQTAVLLMVVAAVLYRENPRVKYVLGGGVALLVGVLLKPVFYPLVGVVALGGIWLAWQERRPTLGISGLMPLAFTLMYMSWNEQRTGYFHFSSIAEINLLHYNAAGVVRQLQGGKAEERWVAGIVREANAQPTFAARQQLIRMRAGAMLWAHPVVYGRQHLLGMGTLFLDPGRFDISQFLRLAPLPGGGLLAQVRAQGWSVVVRSLPWGLLVLLGGLLLANGVRLGLAIRGFRRLGRDEPVARYARWVAVVLLAYVALLTGPLGATRFLVPVWPLLLALALAGLEKNASLSDAEQASPVRED